MAYRFLINNRMINSKCPVEGHSHISGQIPDNISYVSYVIGYSNLYN